MSEHLKSLAREIGKMEGYEYWIVPCPCSYGFNGYVVFPRRPVKEKGYRGILTYVPVHGGITYAKPYKRGIVYGFDTGHFDSDKYPIGDENWIKKQIKIMIVGILKAKEVEDFYLWAELADYAKERYAKEVLDTLGDPTYSNFGVDINRLFGQV